MGRDMSVRPLSVQELNGRGYYYRWVRINRGGKVLTISIEKDRLTEEFEKFLIVRGFEKDPSRLNQVTDHFHLEEG